MGSIRPLHGAVLVIEDPQYETSKGGLVLPDRAKNRPRSGIIHTIGPDTSDDLCVEENGKKRRQLEIGDRILYTFFDGVEMFQNGTKLLYMKEENVVAVIDKEVRVGQG